jgi:hypothetical protein
MAETEKPDDKALYTLEEAAAELEKRLCSTYGHEWDTLLLGMIQPVQIKCVRCGVTYDLVKVEDK